MCISRRVESLRGELVDTEQPARAHDVGDAAKMPDIFERVFSEHDQIGDLARRDDPDILTSHGSRAVSRRHDSRIVVVLSFLRMAIGTQSIPPTQLIVGLSLFLTMFVMGPIFEQIYDEAIVPYVDEQIDHTQAIDLAMDPIRRFMLKNTREKDLALFTKLAHMPRPASIDDLSSRVLIPSFVISELKTAFQISFVLFIPFIIIDMVVSSTLLSMGMMMLPPVTVSLPFKILLFVLVDGWHLIVHSIVASFK